MKAGMLLLAVLVASCSRERPASGLRIDGGPEEVGARLFVEGRLFGTLKMKKDLWIVASPLDTVGRRATHRQQQIASVSYSSYLNVTVGGGKRRQLVFIGVHGERLETVVDLADSAEIYLSFARRLLKVAPVFKPTHSPGDDGDDYGDGYHDEMTDTGASTVADTMAKPSRGRQESARAASRNSK